MGQYGSDTSTRMGEFSDDLDTTGAELDDQAVIGEDLVRACTIPAGALFYAPGDTFDVNSQLGKTGTVAERGALGRIIEDRFARDERYEAVDAAVERGAENLLSVGVVGTTDSGNFELQLEQDGDAMRVVKLG